MIQSNFKIQLLENRALPPYTTHIRHKAKRLTSTSLSTQNPIYKQMNPYNQKILQSQQQLQYLATKALFHILLCTGFNGEKNSQTYNNSIRSKPIIEIKETQNEKVLQLAFPKYVNKKQYDTYNLQTTEIPNEPRTLQNLDCYTCKIYPDNTQKDRKHTPHIIITIIVKLIPRPLEQTLHLFQLNLKNAKLKKPKLKNVTQILFYLNHVTQ
eukprot:TRINITY_DN2202_c0_g1_i1.p1 TRINITY_DN2202_c0_g1~~TRINITY_DN2202_c0_g1_i1.p1  ORF type:complete len:211 (+),score=-4.76 TRINITY_DN2202_c0_g1_i1:449-1081(+)